MKITWKACLATLLGLTTLAASALESPTFSTTESPTWYQIKFTTGSAILKDMGAGSNLQLAAQNKTDETQWQLIGTESDFKLRDKAGRFVGFSSSKFTAVANEADAVSLRLGEHSNGTGWEIGRTGVANFMNPWQGTGVGKELGEWRSGDANNSVEFIPASPVLPAFSAADGSTATWYLITFCTNGNAIIDNGVGANCTRFKPYPSQNNNQWKLVGNKENLQIVNKDGHYLTVKGSGSDARLTTAAAPDASGFALVESLSSTHPISWEIKANSIAGNNSHFNMWNGADDSAGEIGFYGPASGETNNSIRFVNPDDYVYGEFPFAGSTTYRPEQPLTLWYTRPGTDSANKHQWMDLGLPIGNGQLGAMILGGIAKEDISVNEKTLWTGDTELRGSYSYGCYQNFGSLYVHNNEEGISYADAPQDYWRNLDLTTGVATVHYKNKAGVTFTRRYIASYPDKVVAALFEADKAGAVSLNFQEVPGMARNHEVSYSVDGNTATIEYHGKFEIVTYCSVIKITPTGANASITTDGNSIDVKNADKVYVTIAAGTDYDPVAPTYTSGTAELGNKMESTAAAAIAKGWDSVLADQMTDHQQYFNRVDFSLAGATNDMPTDQMKAHYSSVTASNINVNDPAVKMLETLYFHYGRYLEIGSSRGIDLPGNLQGIWNGYNAYNPYASGQIAPWNADIHTNINVQMCYWPCEPTNLSEMHMPFLNYIINQATIQPQWRDFARKVTEPAAKDPDAWTCAVENNIFGGMGSYDTKYSVANAWYCTHLWQHYAYTLDKEFLARALPTMWGAAKFWLDRMILASDGTYECPNESSPEHGPHENGVPHAQQIVAELLSNVLDAVKALPDQQIIDAAGLERLKDRYSKMDKGLAIETYTGAWGAETNGIKTGDPLLREWKYSPYTAGANGHRHISHLMCLYPYSQIEPGSPEHEAAVNSLRQRGDEATGWSIGWKINLWARAMDGNHARRILRNGLSNMTYNNLFDSHPPYQIDGNFGACTGIAEMLMQSHNDVIYILPALPTLWKEGAISGLKAHGDFSIDIAWKAGKLNTATITSNKGGDLKLYNKNIKKIRFTVNGETVEPVINTTTKTTVLPTEPGSVITMTYDMSYTNENVENSAIEEVVVSQGSIKVSVSNGRVYANGPVSAMKVYDLSGRLIAATAERQVNVSAGSKVILVSVTDLEGNISTHKLAI